MAALEYGRFDDVTRFRADRVIALTTGIRLIAERKSPDRFPDTKKPRISPRLLKSTMSEALLALQLDEVDAAILRPFGIAAALLGIG